jgi:hypothetical protein
VKSPDFEPVVFEHYGRWFVVGWPYRGSGETQEEAWKAYTRDLLGFGRILTDREMHEAGRRYTDRPISPSRINPSSNPRRSNNHG